jgi:hypothetical protein
MGNTFIEKAIIGLPYTHPNVIQKELIKSLDMFNLMILLSTNHNTKTSYELQIPL